MRRYWLVVILLGPLVLSGIPALGQTESATVLVFVDPQPGRPGAIVNVTVYVFSRGSPVDPASLSVRMEQAPGTTVSVSRVDKGVYAGTLEIAGEPFITLRATAEIAGAFVVGRATVSIEAPISMQVRASTNLARPGQLVNISINTSSYDVPEDPDRLQVEALVRESLGPSRQPVPLVPGRLDVGRYWVDYEVPQDIRNDARIEFSVLALLGSYGIGTTASVLVDFPEPLEIWYHSVLMDPSLSAFEIFVANSTGSRVVGAYVSVAYAGFPSLQGSQNGTTGLDGGVRFEFPLNRSSFVTLTGTVVVGTVVQGFRGGFSVPQEIDGPWEIRRENPLDRFVREEPVALQYVVRENGTPLAGIPVYYYVYTRTEMVAYGTASTDQEGEFEVRFVPPFPVITVDLAAEIAGSWVTATELVGVPLTHRLTADIGPAIVGDKLRISGVFPSTAGPWTLAASVSGLSPATDRTSPSTTWTPLYPLSGTKQASGAPGTPFEISLPLPLFLPAGGSLAVELTAVSQAGAGVYGLTEVILLQGQGGSSFTVIFAILLAAIVLSFVAIYILRRPQKPAPSPPIGTTGKEEAGPGGPGPTTPPTDENRRGAKVPP